MVRLVMNWIQLTSHDQLEQLKKESEEAPVLIFKHSTRCSTSRMSLDRLERNWNRDQMKNVRPYFLDLITYRDISNKISESFGVTHESPQVLLISNRASILDLSHFDIDYNEIARTSGIRLNQS
jgi:bacillithiol system protein YtxJ